MRNKWYNITLFMWYINITNTMGWTSISISQMTMISNFIRFNFFSQNLQLFLFLKSSSSFLVIVLFLLVFLKQKATFFSKFMTSSTN